jgi:regulation of enolase protein 1 (concanavalin A-like superfamily)
MPRIVPILLSATIGILISACGPADVPQNKVKIVASTPLPPPALRVEKPVNVSFSTYSKDWPIDWQWIDPDQKNNPARYDLKTGGLRVRIPTGKDLFGDNRTAPRYIKALIGDFEIETRVKFLPKENYQGAGLLIYKDDENYLRFERAYGGLGGGGEGVRFDIRRGDEFTPIAAPGAIQTDAEVVDLKLVRSGGHFAAYWRTDENAEWRLAGEVDTDYPETVMAGVVACNTAREVTAEFLYIHLLPPPR